jgi:uncharacterized membrane protein YczE
MLAAVLGNRSGVGSVVGVLVIGVVVNTALPVLERLAVPGATAWVMMAASIAVLCFGIAATIASGLGPGPVEAVMVALLQRRVALLPVRFGLDGACLFLGVVLGGSAGAGTVVFLFSAGFALQILTPYTERLAGTGKNAGVVSSV